ncbi:MAG TPA: hypothetical protein VGU20_13960 [Stellaceae bacterium]|nr:hypothetical protein [Stellaceae bacterium]
MIDGTWAFVYAGDSGMGIGCLVIKDGKLRGTDAGGVKYSGSIAEHPSNGELSIELTMNVPAGTWLVGGAGALDMPHTRNYSFTLPPRFGELAPVDLPVFPGKTIAMFKLVSDEFARFADGFEVRLKSS